MDRSTEGSPDRCQKCDVQITSSEAGGLCPRCLLEVGLGGQEPTVILDGRAPKPVPSPMFPFDFGGYRVRRLLGQGGMGAVYEAEQVDTGRRIALKLLEHSLDSPEARRRFLREGLLTNDKG